MTKDRTEACKEFIESNGFFKRKILSINNDRTIKILWMEYYPYLNDPNWLAWKWLI